MIDVEVLQDLLDCLGFAPEQLRKGVLCEVPRKVVNDVYVALGSKTGLSDWKIVGTIPEEKTIKISIDLSGNGTGRIMDTGLLYLKVSDRFCMEPLK